MATEPSAGKNVIQSRIKKVRFGGFLGMRPLVQLTGDLAREEVQL